MMVKGTNRRVVVVRSPDPRIFEEAIFVIRDDAFHKDSSPDRVLAEARQAADAYLKKTMGRRGRKKDRVSGKLLAAAGTAAVGIAWITAHFAGLI
ncbi:MAG: translation initiation factor 2 [Oscillospiraceae bacterium]|nr:translation initiation factor 2 [Oscillospiraceae bacterium]